MRKWVGIGGLGAALLIALGIWGYAQYASRSYNEKTLLGHYQRSFYATLDHVQNLQVLLGKSRVASSPAQLADILGNIRSQAAAAQENLTQLPVSGALASNTAKYLAQVSGFADSVLMSSVKGSMPDGKQKDMLTSLYRETADLNRQLHEAEASTMHGRISSSIVQQWKSKITKKAASSTMPQLSAIDTRMQKYPTLIYDGPFSDHLTQIRPSLSGSTINAAQAEKKALSFFDPQAKVPYAVKSTKTVNGSIPFYQVDIQPQNGTRAQSCLVAVAKTGGQVVWMLNQRTLGKAGLNIDDARKKAVSFLETKGFGAMEPTYHRLENNQAIFNFVQLVKGVVDYTRQVKVTVALDNGQVTGFEGSKYLYSGYRSPANKVVLSEEQARKKINNSLAVNRKGKLVLIPVKSAREILAYEFAANQDGDTYLVYINAENGNEEDILHLVNTPQGQLTI